MSIYELLLARPDLATISAKSRQSKHRWWISGPVEIVEGEKRVEALTLSCYHWADRKQFTTTVGVSTIDFRRGGMNESCWVFGSSVQVLCSPVARYSAKAFGDFIEQALTAVRTEEVAAKIEAIIARNAELVAP
jgi:hypothetical protein